MGYENLAQIRPSTGYPDPKESLQLSFSRLPDDLAACWPTERDLAGFRIELETFMNEVQAVSKDVLRVLAEGVGLVSYFFFFPFLVAPRLFVILSRARARRNSCCERVIHSRRKSSSREPSVPTRVTNPIQCRRCGSSNTTLAKGS